MPLHHLTRTSFKKGGNPIEVLLHAIKHEVILSEELANEYSDIPLASSLTRYVCVVSWRTLLKILAAPSFLSQLWSKLVVVPLVQSAQTTMSISPVGNILRLKHFLNNLGLQATLFGLRMVWWWLRCWCMNFIGGWAFTLLAIKSYSFFLRVFRVPVLQVRLYNCSIKM